MVTPVNIYTMLALTLSRLKQRGQELLAHLPELPSEEKFTFKSPQALPLQSLPLAPESPFARVLSLEPVQPNLSKGQTCQLRGEPIQNIQPETRYAFPVLVIELIAPDQHSEELELSIPPFKTFAHGNIARHLSEYLATSLDLDLEMLGFQVLRQDSRLVFQALPGREGWNIRIQDLILMPLPAGLKACHMGLKPGLSSLNQEQIPGTLGQLNFGSYLLNGIEISLKLENRQSQFSGVYQEILNQLNQHTAETGVRASFNPENYLVLTQTQSGSAGKIEIRRLSSESPEIQALHLPEGLFMGEEAPEPETQNQVLGQLELNGQVYDFGEEDLCNPEALQLHIKTLATQIYIQTGLQIHLDAEGFLQVEGREIQLKDLGTPWQFESICAQKLSPDWDLLQTHLNHWLEEANQCLRQIRQNPNLKPLEAPLRQMLLSELPGQSGIHVNLSPETGLQLALKFELLQKNYAEIHAGFAKYLHSFPTKTEKILHNLSELEKHPEPQPTAQRVSTPQYAQFMAKPTQKNSPAPSSLTEPEEEGPLPSFDHKI